MISRRAFLAGLGLVAATPVKAGGLLNSFFARGTITLVGTPTEGSAGSGGDITLLMPTGVAQNDVVYVFFATSSSGGTSSSGWTQIGSDLDNGADLRTQVWRKVMGASPDASIVLTGSGIGSDAGVGIAFALRGVNTTTPEDATATTATGTSADPDSPSITTVTPNAWVISFAGSRANDSALTAPSGYSNEVDLAQAESNNISGGGATKEVTAAGAENPASWTDWTSAAWAAWSVAVRPA